MAINHLEQLVQIPINSIKLEGSLAFVQSHTLLIVGGNDDIIIELNRETYARLKGKKQLVIAPEPTHLFEEPGTLEEVARLATDWFKQYVI